MSPLRVKAINGLSIGDTFSIQRTFVEKDMKTFSEITRDYNPVHFDDRFVSAKKFNGRICHGLLVASMLTEIGGQIGWLATEMDFKFLKPVYFGDTITCTLKITRIDDKLWAEAEAIYKNQSEDIVLKAFLSGKVPGEKEKEIMKTMMNEGDPTNKVK